MADPEQDAPALTYASAGVDIDRGEEAVARIAAAAKRTHGPGVVGGLGGFGGLFALKDALGSLDDPLLVSGTDGVGTKLLVAKAANKHDTIGQDLVAMCVNDILTLGARPLFFLDYFATSTLDPEQMAEVVGGIAAACEATGIALLGGETAELPGLYQPGDYDLAGFAVGAVERSAVIDGNRVAAGDAILGLASSGLHSNGYSLARKVVFERMGLLPGDELPLRGRSAGEPGGPTVGEALLAPTRLYVKPVLGLLEAGVEVRAMAHITGGGLPGNLARPFPPGLGAVVDPTSWEEPAIFDLLRTGGPVEEPEMRKTFNLGVGYALVVPEADEERALEALLQHGERAVRIGTVTEGDGVRFGPKSDLS